MSTLGTHNIVNIPEGSDLVSRAAYAAELQRIEDGIQHLTALQTNASTTAYETDAPFQAYETGQTFIFVPLHDNTGAASINVNSLGAKKLCDAGGTQISDAGTIQSHHPYLLIYDSALDTGAGGFYTYSLGLDFARWEDHLTGAGGDDEHPLATVTDPGLMSADDKIKADSLARSATRVVASFYSSAEGKSAADYVCDGTDDQVEINQAIASLAATGGGRVILLEGVFNIECQPVGSGPAWFYGVSNNSIDNVILEGQGPSSILSINAAGVVTDDNIVGVYFYEAENCAVRDFSVEAASGIDTDGDMFDIMFTRTSGVSNLPIYIQNINTDLSERTTDTTGIYTSSNYVAALVKDCNIAAETGIRLGAGTAADNRVQCTKMGISASFDEVNVFANRIHIEASSESLRTGISIGSRSKAESNHIEFAGAGGGVDKGIGSGDDNIILGNTVVFVDDVTADGYTRKGIEQSGDKSLVNNNRVIFDGDATGVDPVTIGLHLTVTSENCAAVGNIVDEALTDNGTTNTVANNVVIV